jgi:hypothetical protein
MDQGFWKMKGVCGAQLSVTLASRALSPPLANFQHVLSILELHEVELVEEPLASKQAVTGFREFRHEAGCCHECGAAEPSHFDLDRVEIDRATYTGDDAADVTDSGRVVGEIDAQEVSDFGGEMFRSEPLSTSASYAMADVAVSRTLRSTMGITGRSIGAPCG